MKSYFAKYLPVEGEIKFPTDLWCPHEGLRLNCQSMACPDCNPVKLFLCSRDIQVGDKIFDTYSGLELEVTNQNFPSNASDFWVKKIGEISSDATWVKERDQLDDTQVLALEWGGSSVRRPVKMIRKEFYDDGHMPKIYVKCPTCKKFH